MHTYWLLGKEGFDKPLPIPPSLETEEVLFEADIENDSETITPPEQPDKQSPTGKSQPLVHRQRSDTSTSSTKFAWQRSGALSADSSPPPKATPTGAITPTDHIAPYSRYRCLAGGPRALRRQWSLERGDAMAAAAGARDAGLAEACSPPLEPLEPLALLAPPAPRAALTRYRTRPDAPAPLHLDQTPPVLAPTLRTDQGSPKSCSP